MPRKARGPSSPLPSCPTSWEIRASAGRYYELALKSHSSDPHVQLAAARWFARTGDFSTAEKHAQIALSLAPDMDQARSLLGEIYLQTDRAA